MLVLGTETFSTPLDGLAIELLRRPVLLTVSCDGADITGGFAWKDEPRILLPILITIEI